jgi:hypothetical protein
MHMAGGRLASLSSDGSTGTNAASPGCLHRMVAPGIWQCGLARRP